MHGQAISPFLSDALVILGAAGIVIPLFARLRITPVIGFILVGVLVGPFGLGRMVPQAPWLTWFTITDPQGLEPFAEFGITLLLFTIGLELSFNRLWTMRRLVFGLGALEMASLALLLGGLLMLVGQPWTGALGLGLALALSSTALVLPIAGTQTPVGRAALAMLLFEDIALVPIVFLLGALGGPGLGGLVATIWQGLLVVVAMMVIGRFALPLLFAQAARTKSPELFLAATLLVVIGASLATSLVGLSPIVGALVAGLLIAETEYHVEVEGIIDPFKGLALGVFLLTVGMSIDLRVVWSELSAIALAVVAVLALKALVTAALLRLMGAHRSTATEAGILMASPSETTLIVLGAASAAALIQPGTAQFWQIVTAIGLTVTPLLARAGQLLARRVEPAPVVAEGDPELPRVLIVGCGRCGRLVADMLTRHGRAYVALDSDADMIAQCKRDGYHAVFGNAARIDVLERLGLARAPAVVLTMDEPVLAQRLTKKLRAAHPEVPIIARARDPLHAAELYKAGASTAVPETLEASLQLSEAVLVDLGVAMGPVIASIHEKRDEFRDSIREGASLDHKPKLRTTIRPG
ncbi:MAG TPA: cation:proton antiporter [Croceibacterium sp.]|nr:cation:proton antiporter [Croceibacterium sp.]